MDLPSPLPRNDAAWSWWQNTMKSPRYVMAPMVDGSELPFRQLCRRYGVDLCYSPMVQASIIVAYMKKHKKWDLFFETEETDRPLVFQIGGNNPKTVLEGASLLQHVVDAVDLNLGCPQRIASRGGYGAFLMSQPDVVEKVVRALSTGLKVPVLCKIRILPSLEETVKFAQMLQNAGCTVLTVHGRTKEQRGQNVGDADWNYIAAIKRSLGIPVILNGNIKCKADADRAMQVTGCDAVMSAWGLLSNPRLFAADAATGLHASSPLVGDFHRGHSPLFQVELAEEYVAVALQYVGKGTTIARARLHLFKILAHALEAFPRLREQLAVANNFERIQKVLVALRSSIQGQDFVLSDDENAVVRFPRDRDPVVVDEGCGGGGDQEYEFDLEM